MSLIATSRTLYVLLGLGLLGLGVFALVHPEFARGGSLILLGLAVLERGPGRAQRLFIWISGKLASGEPPLRRRRRTRPAFPHRVRPAPRMGAGRVSRAAASTDTRGGVERGLLAQA